MNPGAAGLEAFFATARAWLYGLYAVEMRAGFAHEAVSFREGPKPGNPSRGCKDAVDLCHHCGSLPYSRGDPLRRTCPHIADGEDAGPVRLKRQREAPARARHIQAVRARDDEPL